MRSSADASPEPLQLRVRYDATLVSGVAQMFWSRHGSHCTIPTERQLSAVAGIAARARARARAAFNCSDGRAVAEQVTNLRICLMMNILSVAKWQHPL